MAVEQLKKTLEIEPDFWFAHADLGRAYGKSGRLPEAIGGPKSRATVKRDCGNVVRTWRCVRYTGRTNQSPGDSGEVAGTDRSLCSSVPRCVGYAHLGEKDRAFGYLEKAYEQGSIYMSFLKVDPGWTLSIPIPATANCYRRWGCRSDAAIPILKQARRSMRSCGSSCPACGSEKINAANH
jgi:hypothetical protein